MKPIILNMFGGPGVGKSVMLANVFAELKIRGIRTEMAPEFAKELVYEKRHKTFEDQIYIFAKQNHKIFRLLEENEVVITDSPIILSAIYRSENLSESFTPFVIDTFNTYNNRNFLLQRTYPFEAYGRWQADEKEAKIWDNKVKNFLDANGIAYSEIISSKEMAIKIADDIHELLRGK